MSDFSNNSKSINELDISLTKDEESPEIFNSANTQRRDDNFDDAQIVDVIEDLGPEQLLGSFEMDTDLPERSPINAMRNIRNKVDR